MMSCEQLSAEDLVVLHNIIQQQQDQIQLLKKHVSLLLDDISVYEHNKRVSSANDKLVEILKLEVEKLKKDKVKLRLTLEREKEGTYIVPAQRKFQSQQSLAVPTKPPVTKSPVKDSITGSSPQLFERRNTVNPSNRDVSKVKTLDDRELRNFSVSTPCATPATPSTPSGMVGKSATLNRVVTSSNTPLMSVQNRQRNTGIFSSVSRAVNKVRTGNKTRKSHSDPNLSALETSSQYSKDSSMKRGWLKQLFGPSNIRTKQYSNEGSSGGDTLLQTDTSRTMYPCLLGINTLREIVDMSELEAVDFPNWETWKLHQWMDTQGLGIFGQKLPAGWTGAKILHLDLAGLEKLGIKHPLHVKKLVLALKHAGQDDEPGKLPCDSWVLPWLSEIGLPQHVPAFREAMVDGRMLNWLTYQDLNLLRVRLRLHAVSIMRAVELLRECNFEPQYLNRERIDNTTRPADVVYWTHQNVKQWLSTNYFAEFTPALKNTGIHGALIVKEPLITSNFLLKLLKVPSGSVAKMFEAHFNKLIGPHILLEKRLCETDKRVKPMSTQTKLSKSFKSRRGFYNSISRRGRKKSNDWLTYVVPFSDDSRDNSVAGTVDMSFETQEEISGIQKEVQHLTILLSSPESEHNALEEDPLDNEDNKDKQDKEGSAKSC